MASILTGAVFICTKVFSLTKCSLLVDRLRVAIKDFAINKEGEGVIALEDDGKMFTIDNT